MSGVAVPQKGRRAGVALIRLSRNLSVLGAPGRLPLHFHMDRTSLISDVAKGC